MFSVLKSLGLGLMLIFVASAILLLSDRTSHVSAPHSSAGPISIALLKSSSSSLLDEAERGLIKGLQSRGYVDGETISLRRFNAENDFPTLNAIACQITDGSYQMALTVSTLSCQAVAGANKQGKAIHVFCAVTDPAGAGIGLKAMNTTDKPPYLAGIGSFQPVASIFRFARELWPDLNTVGVVWNQAEANSLACTIKAREISKALGITLLEATIEKPHEVGEAAESLIARGVQAFWTGGDTGVNTAIDTLCGTALKARLPVFSNIAGHGQHGTLFDLGADYLEVGQCAANIAADILEGADPALIAVTNFMPEKIVFNRKVLKHMKDPWRFPASALAKANSVIEEDGTEHKSH